MDVSTGAVTFAFVAIDGGADSWEGARESISDAKSRCDAIVRDVVLAHGGAVLRAFGDTTCSTFERPARAVAAAIALQLALAREDVSAVSGLAVRCAIHSGGVDPRDGEHFGPASHRAQALLEFAYSGQILVSVVTRDLVRDALPAGASLRDLGSHRLTGLTRPERVFGIVAPGLAADFPLPRSIEATPNNLPRSLTSFVGRDAETAEIGALLAVNRLVSIVGPGGIGKTRMAIAVAARAYVFATGGVWFAELAPLASGAYVASTVARAMGIALGPGEPRDELVGALATKSALLVLDTCEHVRDDAAAVVAAILHGCPGVKVVATSRQSLEVAGERTYRLGPLALDAAADAPSSSVALFLERARAVDVRFDPDQSELATVAEIVRRLDGIPLAIELAAARVRMLRPRELRDRLDERFRILAGGDRAAMPRQQTLRALIDWSYDLLDDRERALFRRLAIFASGFAFEGALAVGAGVELDEFDLLDVLGSLVDKSLVVAELGGESARYRMLESTRVYAREKLEECGERDACADRHLRYLHGRFVAVRERCEETARRAELHAALALDLDDVRAALDRAAATGDAVLGALLLAESSGRAWASLGLTNENRTRARALLGVLPDAEPAAAALLSIAIAFVEANDGRRASALEATTYAVACARASGEERILAQALLARARHCAMLPNFLDDAEGAIREVDALLPRLPREFRVRALHETAFASLQRGALDAAEIAYDRLRHEHRELGNLALVDLAILNLAEVIHARGRTRESVALLRDLLPGIRERRDRQIVITVLANLAAYSLALDETANARASACEILRELGEREPSAAFAGVAIEHLALAFALDGDLERAATLHGYADAAILASGFERAFTEKATRERLVAHLAEHLPAELAVTLYRKGEALFPNAAIRLALGA